MDYRKLNEVTKKDAHTLPRVDDLLEALNRSQYVSTLDLLSGYWQIGMVPEDREKTAFVTPDGLWEFLWLPFGFSGGPATFQQAIEIVLYGVTYDTCLCYVDDIIIPSTSIKQQCDRQAAFSPDSVSIICVSRLLSVLLVLLVQFFWAMSFHLKVSKPTTIKLKLLLPSKKQPILIK